MPRDTWTVIRRCLGFLLLFGLVMATMQAPTVQAQPRGTVGIRISVSNVDPDLASADLDLTMYTRGYGPTVAISVANAGLTGIPALDYGDGNTIPSTSLLLTNSGGGPGGSNVYRSAASFSHTYPDATMQYTATSGILCAACRQSSYVFFPMGSPAPTAFTQTADYRPASIIGNRAVTSPFSGTTFNTFLSSSVRRQGVSTLAITNTALVSFLNEIPTVSQWGLIFLGASILLAGVVLLRRFG